MNYFERLKSLIAAFLAMYPDAEWGPGHIVLSDYNLEDGFIDGTIIDCEQWLNETPPPENAGDDWLDEHTHEEVAATMEFLRFLRALPDYWKEYKED